MDLHNFDLNYSVIYLSLKLHYWLGKPAAIALRLCICEWWSVSVPFTPARLLCYPLLRPWRLLAPSSSVCLRGLPSSSPSSTSSRRPFPTTPLPRTSGTVRLTWLLELDCTPYFVLLLPLLLLLLILLFSLIFHLNLLFSLSPPLSPPFSCGLFPASVTEAHCEQC